jgi:signal transduction histidine kinase
VALAGLAVTIAALIAQGLEDRHIAENIWAAAFFWLAWFAVWLAGLFVGSRRDAAALGRRAVELEQQRAEAIAAERARIARELHDVIAHHISVVVIQAVAAMGILDRHPERTREPLQRIEQSGREALSELRRLLGILRQDEDRSALAPQPSLADLGALLDGVRGAGLPVELQVEGAVRPLPRGIDVSAYRIVQEALTNTLKHAGVASAQVKVRYGRDALELEVTDTGRGPGTGNGVGAGHGLLGMRERVVVYGGDLETGPKDDGGYLVRALLPLDTEPA